MSEKQWEPYNQKWRYISLVYGFVLMAGLSRGGVFASCFVAMIIVLASCYAALWLRTVRRIATYHGFMSNIVLLAAAVAYIFAKDFLLQSILFWIMILCGFLNLYRTCCYEKVNLNYIKRMFGDASILLLLYTTDLFEWEKSHEFRKMKHKCINGICVLVFLLCCLVPLYIMAEDRMGYFIYVMACNCVEKIPTLLICIFLGMFPAMLYYSVVKGLALGVVFQNPSRYSGSHVNVNHGSLYYNETVMKIILWGLAALNTIFCIFQVIFIFNAELYGERTEEVYHMSGVLPLLAAIGINVIFAMFGEFLLTHGRNTSGLALGTWIHLLSTAGILGLLVIRYVIKIVKFGIGEDNIIEILALLLLGIILCIELRVLIVRRGNVARSIAVWMAAGFILFNILPLDYLVARVNVVVFMNRYNSELAGQNITKYDLDLFFLEQIGLDAVPALVDLMGIKEMYEPLQKSVGEAAWEAVVIIFQKELSEEDKAMLEGLEADEKIEKMMEILGGKFEYRVFGKQKKAYRVFSDYLIGH